MTRTIEEVKADILALNEPEEPTVRRFKTDNATVEKLHELLSNNPRGILVLRDELKGLLARLDSEEHAADRAFFIEGWSGGGTPYYIDRIGRGTVCAENGICLSIFGGIQPGKLLSYLNQAINEIENDGLFQRFQVMVYPDPVNWQHIDKAPDKNAIGKALKIIEALGNMDFTKFGAEKAEENDTPFFHFDKEAQILFDNWLIELNQKKLIAKEHPVILEHLAKYQKLVPTLALIFHLIELADGGNSGSIRKESIARAVKWAIYLESHMRRIYDLVLGNSKPAKKLSEKILNRDVASGFTARDIYINGWSNLNSVEKTEAACEILLKAKWLQKKIIQPSQTGGRGSVQYIINPKIYQL